MHVRCLGYQCVLHDPVLTMFAALSLLVGVHESNWCWQWAWPLLHLVELSLSVMPSLLEWSWLV